MQKNKYSICHCELAQALARLFSDSDFNEIIDKQINDKKGYVRFLCDTGGMKYITIDIPKSLIKALDNYDPNRWNKFPEVEPPEGVLMRLELITLNTDYHKQYKAAGIYKNGAWLNQYEGIDFEHYLVNRFRPWE